MSESVRVYILATKRFTPVFSFLLNDSSVKTVGAAEADVAIIVNEDPVHIAIKATEAPDKPMLFLVDGIVEWRNLFTRPDRASEKLYMSLFHPVLSHKVACIGPSQARLLEHWGNLGKCEVTGSPRLDPLFAVRERVRERREDRKNDLEKGAMMRVLVITAKRPGFNDEQMAAVERGLSDVKAWAEQWNADSNRPGPAVSLEWRVTRGLDEKLGVNTSASEFSGAELAEVLERVDAVVTTPSTAMLEAMFLEKPVALLDYTNSPHYVPAAWEITSPQHVDPVMRMLLNPHPHRMLYQDYILHDAWRCDEPAAPRVIKLIREMVRIGRECREKGLPLRFPNRMVEGPDPTWPSRVYDPKAIFPNHPILWDMDLQAMRAELGNFRLAWRTMEREHQSGWYKLGQKLMPIRRVFSRLLGHR